MSSGFAWIPLILLASTIAAIAMAQYAWNRRDQPGAAWLALSELTGGIWTAFDLFNFLVDLGRVEVVVKAATWSLILIAGFAFFRFACTYTRHQRWWDLARIPVVTLIVLNLVVMITNPLHGWMWPGVRWVDFGFTSVPWLESGPAFFWLFRPVAYGLPAAGALVLLLGSAGLQTFYLWRVALVAAAAFIPIAANYFLVSPTAPSVDVTPITVVMVMAAFAGATLRYGLLDIVPIARGLFLEQLDDGVVVLDRQDRVVDVNRTAEALLHCGPWQPGIEANALLPAWAEYRTRMAESAVESLEIEPERSDQVIELMSSPITAEEGAALGRLLVLHDMTDKARLIRDLDNYAETVAHDLKTPLTQLVQKLETVQANNAEIGEESAEMLGHAERVCRQMTQTIDALLCFAQLRSVEQVAVEPLDMKAIVDSAIARLSALISANEADIDMPREWPTALGHPIWIEEIWANYISNAIKYGGTPPKIELGADSVGQGVLRFWVRDNGPGLSPAQQARLFTEFTRLEPERNEGHGLGLSIVQRIAEKLGGKVGCESIEGQGSRFWFTLSSA